MRTVLLFGSGVLALLAPACATLVGFPDVPGLEDSGAGTDGSVSHDAARDAGRPDASPGIDAPRALDARLPPPVDAGPSDGGPQSCPPSVATCGTSSESCCTTLQVVGSTFFRVYEGSSVSYPADVANFWLDKYLVTVGRFRQFAIAWSELGYRPPAGSGKHTHLANGLGLENGARPGTYETGWDTNNEGFVVFPTENDPACAPSTFTDAPGDGDDLPINCVPWATAYAFCIWDGGFLPSEAEWEYAAGGENERTFPWGNEDPGTANLYAIYGCNEGPKGCPIDSTVANLAAVGSASVGAGSSGQVDLVGNVAEWVLDYYAPYVNTMDQWSNSAYLTPYVDDAGGPTYPSYVERGGSFASAKASIATTARSVDQSSASDIARSSTIGFRCARAL